MREMPLWLPALFIAACAGDPASSPLRIGEPCGVDEECETGVCWGFERGTVCSTACTTDAECAPYSGLGSGTCRESGYCGPPCPPGTVTPDRRACAGSVLVACDELDPALHCGSCGCPTDERCVESVGCILPGPEGSPCTRAEECASMLCEPATHTCSTLREEGEPCRSDAECATQNCSSDGRDVEGVCNMRLGSSCTSSSNCSRCILSRFGGMGFCSRATCNGTTAPNCPMGFSCVAAEDGTSRCFEICNPDAFGYVCRDPTGICWSDGYCY